jgi:hypothetical protein
MLLQPALSPQPIGPRTGSVAPLDRVRMPWSRNGPAGVSAVATPMQFDGVASALLRLT